MTMGLTILGLAVGIWAAAAKSTTEPASLLLFGVALIVAARSLRRVRK